MLEREKLIGVVLALACGVFVWVVHTIKTSEKDTHWDHNVTNNKSIVNTFHESNAFNDLASKKEQLIILPITLGGECHILTILSNVIPEQDSRVFLANNTLNSNANT